jgi:hypothetical protein
VSLDDTIWGDHRSAVLYGVIIVPRYYMV